MKLLSTDLVKNMHSRLIDTSGGIDGIRDHNLLDSALHTPFQTFDGIELYPSPLKKAACLCYCLVNNHAFIDGNKRIGILVMLTFLELNGIDIQCDDKELVQLGLGIAAGDITQEMIFEWLQDKV